MITVRLTNGFGNNLFQYNAARILAINHQQPVYAHAPSPEYYGIPALRALGVEFVSGPPASALTITDNTFRQAFDARLKENNFYLTGYFEDYTYFKDYLGLIKTWYPPIDNFNRDDLVIHFRAGDRLFYKNEFHLKPSIERYLKAIERFEFKKLFIVTDMPQWKHTTVAELEEMQFHHTVSPQDRVESQLSVDYFNSCIDGFSRYSPTIKHGDVLEDFNFIRSFDKILFQHGTLAWWASALSDASQVGVYGPWRPWKGLSNKNLSQVGLKGWFQWE